jgi:hypothetical protein
MDGAQGSSPVTHNVYTTGSGSGTGDGGGGSSAMHSLIPALMAMGQNNNGNQHLPALAAAALAGSGANRGTHAGVGAAAGGAIGFVLGALLNGNGGGGLFGGNNRNNNGDNTVTTTELNTALNAQTANQNTNSILQQLASIAVAIPENEGKVQLAIAQSQNALQNQGNQNSIMAIQGVAAINQNIAGATATVLAGETAVKDAVNGASTLSQLGIAGLSATAQQLAGSLGLQAANNTSAILSALRDDGDKTRALVTAFNDATLNRIITTQANEIIELKGDRTVANQGMTITQTVNQAQAQSQAQQQQQQQLLILSQIGQSLAGLTQIAHATNQNVIAGNTGAVSTGPQSANPVNVA